MIAKLLEIFEIESDLGEIRTKPSPKYPAHIVIAS